MAKRILIVDDNKPLARMMISALETLPYPVKVTSVPSGEEALLAVMLDRPDLMVVDLHLPGMSGMDLIRILRERYENLNIVMATGEHDPAVFRRAEELGVEYRFPKPFETVAFLDAVNRMINGEGLTRKEMNLPAEPPERMEDTLPGLSFSDAVIELRDRLNALSVVILGDSGRIIVQAGKDLNEVFSAGWELPTMALLSAVDSLQRHLPGDARSQMQTFQTNTANIVLMPVGRHGLLVVLPTTREKAFIKKEIEVILDIQQRISTFTPPFENAYDPSESLEQAEVVEAVVDEEVEVQEIDIASLFSNSAREKEAESFWNAPVEEGETPPIPRGTTGYLDFSQAKQLGLTPEEED